MNDNATDFIKILQEIRGTSAQGENYTDGMWWELTIKVIDYMNAEGSHPGGIYTHIKYMYENMKTDLGTFYENYGEFLIKYADFLIKYEEMLLLKEDIDDALEEAEGIGEAATSEFWKTMAERMTASSYAVEPVDVFVKIWTSVGDGTFYNEPTTSYSALHWALKADEVVDGSAYYKLDGTTPLAANMDASTYKITNVGSAINDDEAVNLGQMDAAIGSIVQQDVFLKGEHLSAATGGADSGLPIVLNGNGKVDATFIDLDSTKAVGSHDPSAGGGSVNEYPLDNWCTTDNVEANWGSYWFVTELINEDGGVPGAGYTFGDNSCPSGSLFGTTINEGDIMLFTSSGWLVQKSTIDPDLYYRLDGSRPITAPFAGGGQKVTNIGDGVNDNDSATMGQLRASTSMPIGTILMFSGNLLDLDSYPQWFLCDGNNGTIDMRDRFAYGTGLQSELDAVVTGGSANSITVAHTHTGPNHSHSGTSHVHSATHNHSASFNGSTSGTTHNHGTIYAWTYRSTGGTHRISTDSGGNAVAKFIPTADASAGAPSGSVTVHTKTFNTGSGGSGNTGNAGTGSTSSTGSSGVGKNLPPYIKLAYIQKVSD